jgi:virulence factor Mce-like protein
MTGRAKGVLALAVAVTVTASGCASSGLAGLPLPHPGMRGGGYTLTAVFSDALNLPAAAKVRLGGADVGQLTSLKAQNYTAVATLRIMHGVRLPVGTRAELRSATPLGDIFIAMQPPSTADADTPLLKEGDTLPLDQTSDGATVESVLSSAAILVNGGAVRNLTNLVNGLGKATGDQGYAFGQLIEDTNVLLGKLTSRSDQISSVLTELSTLSDELNAKDQVISDVMSAAPPATQTLAQETTQIADLVQQVGATTELLARFPSIAGTDSSGRSVIGDMNTVSAAFNDVVLHPDAQLAPLNRLLPPLIKASASSGVSSRLSIDKLILGSIPDIGFPGDTGLHGPKWSNWNQLVGSFKYTLFRLQERLVGRGPGVPQVPVIPSPTDHGQWQVVPPAPGPTAPGQFVSPPGPAPGPAPAPAPAAAPEVPTP